MSWVEGEAENEAEKELMKSLKSQGEQPVLHDQRPGKTRAEPRSLRDLVKETDEEELDSEKT